MNKATKIIRSGAQGDVMLIRTDTIPSNATLTPRENGKIIVTHSETGHHHVIERPSVNMYQDPEDPLAAWLEVHGEEGLPNVAALIHERSFDTHGTLEIPVGKWKIRRQRESTPEGYRAAQD